jgi:hypothetical protein
MPKWRYVALDLALALFPKGSGDCRRHRWYRTSEDRVERCSYCQVGVRLVPAEASVAWNRAVECAQDLMLNDHEFAALVDRVFHAAGSPEWGTVAEALVLASWLRYSEDLPTA